MSAIISTMMHRDVRTIDMDDTVAQVEALFAEHALTWAPVLEAGRVIVGVISAADLLQVHRQGGDPTTLRAWQLCTYKPISVDQATPISEVARQMVEQRIHHVVVTSGASLAGVVSSLDFVRTFVGGS